MILNDVKKRMTQAASELGGRVAAGACTNHDEYRHMTGRIRGLQDAIEIVSAVENELREDGPTPDDLPEMPKEPSKAGGNRGTNG